MPSVKKNFAFSLAYEFLAFVVPLVTAPYLSRVLGPVGMGDYSYSYNVAYYFGMFTTLGMLRYGTRSIAAVRDNQSIKNQLFWELLSAQLLCAVVVFTLFITYAVFQNNLLTFIWIPYIISTAIDITWLFRGEEDFKITVIRNSVVKLLTAICIFIFVHKSEDVWIYVLIMSLGYLFSQLALWPYLKRYIKQFVKPNMSAVLRHIKPNALLFIPIVATSVYRVLDKILIGFLSDSAQLGYFDCADKIILVPLGIIGALGTVMLPRMAYLISSGKEETGKEYIRITMSFSMVVAFCLMFGILTTGHLFAITYFGENYSETGDLLKFMCITVPMIAWATVIREQYLIPKKMDKQYITSVVAGAIFNVSLNIFAIPAWGAYGAAVVTIGTELLVCVMLTFYVRKLLSIKQYLKDAMPYVLIGLIMGLGITLVDNFIVLPDIALLLVEIIGGVIVFGMLLFILTRISSSHNEMLKHLTKGK